MTSRHSQHCQVCKDRVGQLLERIYGTCVRDHRFGWHTSPGSYADTPIGATLRDVAQVLEGHREFTIDTLVRSKVLAGCDYWVPDPGLIVEFDESQHFTKPRKLALSAYADRHALGFSAERWMELCERHDTRDNNPAYRDEQRAWYDTLRDLVPLAKGMQPTVRLYVRDHVWCALDPGSTEDLMSFSDLIEAGRSVSPATWRRDSASRPYRRPSPPILSTPSAGTPQPASSLRVASTPTGYVRVHRSQWDETEADYTSPMIRKQPYPIGRPCWAGSRKQIWT